MYKLAELHGNAFLLEKLRAVDSEAAAKLHENNVKRVVRALEAFEISGKHYGERIERSRGEESPYKACIIEIDFDNNLDRQILYDRINKRVDVMVANGLVDEARKIVEEQSAVANCTSAQALGHKELLPFIRGECELEPCIDRLKQKTRNYAKRQMTWFRKFDSDSIHRLSGVQDVGVLEKAINILKKFA
jgi:tRNA dimethylallyltransferase